MIGKNLSHESAIGHVTGKARFIDDMLEPIGLLHALPIGSKQAHATIESLNTNAAERVSGVVALLTHKDIPGLNACSPIGWGEKLFAENKVEAVGQYLGVIVGESSDACQRGLEAIRVEYKKLTPILDIPSAIDSGSFFLDPFVLKRGDVDNALASSPVQIQGVIASGGQDHFYLETQAALAIPGENGSIHIFSSTQHPSEVQEKIADILDVGRHKIVVTCPRMGGAFGGKESQAAQPAAMAALAATITQRPVKICYDRHTDMCQTGKRHPYHTKYRLGSDEEGRILAFKVETFADTGFSPDLSPAIISRSLFHLDNAYFIPNLRFTGRIVKTNTISNTAFRGFGGPQGVVVIEEAINRLAEKLGRDPAEIRQLNYYREPDRISTPYSQELNGIRLDRIHDTLLESSEYCRRRKEIEVFNSSSPVLKRGIGFSPIKFGISFTKKEYNQAGAYILVYGDGTIQVNHGGTEMGQGLHTKMAAIAAHTLGVRLESIRMMDTATDKVPNTSATAASSGSDLNGEAVRRACETIRERLRPVAAELLGISSDEGDGLVFCGGEIWLPGKPDGVVTFEQTAKSAQEKRVPLFANGYYRTPGIHFDPASGKGNPFHYFSYGGAVSEIEINSLTGEYRIIRADILQDVGDSLVPSIDKGQIEGAYIQGVGWLTMEELVWDESGRLLTAGASTYKVPAIGDAPKDFRVSLLPNAPHPEVVYRSKAIGEPPLMLGISAIVALRHAISSLAESRGAALAIRLRLPATPEAVLQAIDRLQASSQ